MNSFSSPVVLHRVLSLSSFQKMLFISWIQNRESHLHLLSPHCAWKAFWMQNLPSAYSSTKLTFWPHSSHKIFSCPKGSTSLCLNSCSNHLTHYSFSFIEGQQQAPIDCKIYPNCCVEVLCLMVEIQRNKRCDPWLPLRGLQTIQKDPSSELKKRTHNTRVYRAFRTQK